MFGKSDIGGHRTSKEVELRKIKNKNNMKMKFILLLIFVVVLNIFLIQPVLALNLNFPLPTGYTVATSTIAGYIGTIYRFAIGISGILAVGMIVAGGIYISVSGAVDKQAEGKDMIISAVWGLVLLFGSYIILNTINPRIVNLTSGTEQIAGLEKVGSFLPSVACQQLSSGVTAAPCTKYTNGSPTTDTGGRCNCLNYCASNITKPPCTVSATSTENCTLCVQAKPFCNETDPDWRRCKPMRISVATDTTYKIINCTYAGECFLDTERRFQASYSDFTIKQGGEVRQYPFYPKNAPIKSNGRIDYPFCLNYAFRISAASTTYDRGGTVGLIACPNPPK